MQIQHFVKKKEKKKTNKEDRKCQFNAKYFDAIHMVLR